MSTPARTIRVAPVTVGRTLEYQLPGGIAQFVQAVYAEVDTSASGDVTPSLTISEQTGVVIAKVPQNDTVDGGGSGSATWALRLAAEQNLNAILSHYLKWGTNTDTGSQGLTLNGNGPFSFTSGGHSFNITSGGAQPLVIDGSTGHVTMKDFWVTVTTANIVGQLDVTGINTNFGLTGTFVASAIQGVTIASNHTAGAGGPAVLDADDITTVSGRGVLISAYSHGVLSAVSDIEARLAVSSGKVFKVTDGTNTLFSVNENGTILGTFDGGSA